MTGLVESALHRGDHESPANLWTAPGRGAAPLLDFRPVKTAASRCTQVYRGELSANPAPVGDGRGRGRA